MMKKPTMSQRVQESTKKALQDEAMEQIVLRFDEARILLSRPRRVTGDVPIREDPPEYPDVPTKLKDDTDSWLK